PVVLLKSAFHPLAVLAPPLVSECSALNPLAVLSMAVLIRFPAPSPTKVLALPFPQQAWIKGLPPKLMTPTLAPVVGDRFRAPPSVPLPSMLKFEPACVVVVFWI